MKKRLFSLVLALVLIFALLPQTVPAASAASGSCGASTSWSFNADTGLLTISGSGSTYNWNNWSSTPWNEYRGYIKSVKINSGVTRVGDAAFGNCEQLASVSFPSSLTEIGDYCFRYDSKLTSISLPSQLRVIGANAFSYCYGLTSVTIPANVYSIGQGAFAACQKLTSIGVNSGNTSYCSSGGALYSKSKQTLIQCPAGISGSFSVPSGVTTIFPYAFEYCRQLTQITLPATVEVLGAGAFYYCVVLERITIPSAVKQIPAYAFASCNNLTTVNTSSGITSIGSYAFNACFKLTGFQIPYNTTEIDSYAFSSCYALAKIDIPPYVTDIGEGAFAWCKGLSRFTVDSGNAYYSNDSRGVLFNKRMTAVVAAPGAMSASYAVPSGVVEIGPCAFSGCTQLPGISLPIGLRTIRENAFTGCKTLGMVTIPTTVTSIGREAFSGCEKLAAAIIPNSVMTIDANVFKNCASNVNIYGAAGSAAQAYAQADAGLTFVCNLQITSQPVSVTRNIGETASFRVGAYSDVSYQWQYMKAGDIGYTDWSGKTTNTLTVTASSTNDGCKYRVRISNQCGTLYSNAATLTCLAAKPVITSNPKSATVAKGETATFKVTATGSGLKYQWQFRKAGTSAWYDWSGKTNPSLPVTGSNTNNGCQYRCVVSNSAGSVNSAAATLTVTGASSKPSITTQPSNQSTTLGKSVSFKVVASGSGLSYQWQFSKDNGSSWYDWSGKTSASMAVTASATNNGCLYRCVVKNSAGSVNSNSARLTVTDSKPVILVQPKAASVAQGGSTTFKVVAWGSGLTYQWQYKKANESTWHSWSGKTSATLTVTGSSTNKGCLYRCVVKNSYGSVTSSEVKLTVT